MKEFYRHKKSDKVKWILTAIAGLLIMVMVTGLCVQVFAPEGKKVTDWFKKEETEQGTVVNENGEVISGGGTVPMPKAMVFNSPAKFAGTEIASATINATVFPESAVNKKVDWNVEFVNSASSWAQGKTVTNYVTVNPTSDGSTTATVKCLAPFGEQIRITVTSRSNPSAKANCLCDFSKRLESLEISNIYNLKGNSTVTFNNSGVPSSSLEAEIISELSVGSVDDSFYTTQLNPSYKQTLGVGTVDNLSNKEYTLVLELNASTISLLQSNGFTYKSELSHSNGYLGYSIPQTGIALPETVDTWEELLDQCLFSRLTKAGVVNISLDGLSNLLVENSTKVGFEFYVWEISNGSLVKKAFDKPITVTMRQSVSSIVLDESTLVF